MNLREFDLNLLVAFDALLRERNVTRAARRVGLTQPAMSNALARLRAALNDPLFVRAKASMVPTPKALELAKGMAAGLREIERALGGATFDASRSDRTFTIAASDYVSCVIMAPLVTRLGEVAPRVKLRIVPLQPDLSLPALESGDIDITLGFYRRVPSGLRRLRVFSDQGVGLVRAGHPILRSRVTVRDLVKYPHVRIAPHGESSGLLDRALAKHGLRRHVVVSSPQFLLALIAAQSDTFASVPERLAEILAAHGSLKIVPLGLPIPRIDVDAYWHARAHQDAGHVWLRNAIVESARSPSKS